MVCYCFKYIYSHESNDSAFRTYTFALYLIDVMKTQRSEIDNRQLFAVIVRVYESKIT